MVMTLKSNTQKMAKKSTYLITVQTLVVIFVVGCSEQALDFKLIPVKIGEQYGYVDPKGTIAIQPQFSDASLFRDGLSLVQTVDGLWGYIGKNGSYAINPIYSKATHFSDGIAWVMGDSGHLQAIDRSGNVLFTLDIADQVLAFSEGLAAFALRDSSSTLKWGYVNSEGIIAVNPQYDAAGSCSQSRCAVKSGAKWAFILPTGESVITPQFDEVYPFKDDLAVVKMGDLFGVINMDGKLIVPPSYSQILPDGDLYLFKNLSGYGWMDEDLNIQINPQFKKAYPFNGASVAAVQTQDGRYSWINREGTLRSVTYDMALPLNDGIAFVISGKKWGMVDGDQNFISNPQFDGLSRDVLHGLVGEYVNMIEGWGGTTVKSIPMSDLSIWDWRNPYDRVSLTQWLSPCGALLSDLYGESYRTVKVGSQCWMAENLRTKKFDDGTPIKGNRSASDWVKSSEPSWASYAYRAEDGGENGLLYNRYVIQSSSPACPIGWRLPSRGDWEKLARISSNNRKSFSPNRAGYLVGDGSSVREGDFGVWWTLASSGRVGVAYVTSNSFDIRFEDLNNSSELYGMSVRCIQGQSKRRVIQTNDNQSADSSGSNSTKAGSVPTKDDGPSRTEIENLESVRQDVASIAASAQGYHNKPDNLGGGGGDFSDLSFHGLTFYSESISSDGLKVTNQNGTYLISNRTVNSFDLRVYPTSQSGYKAGAAGGSKKIIAKVTIDNLEWIAFDPIR